MKKFFTLLFVILTVTVIGQTEVSGNQYGTWDINGSPYLVTGEIVVPAEEMLTIEPGVTVDFQGHYKLTVNGTLTAIGTEQDSILFTADDPATGWHGIRLTESQSESYFSYCHFEHGKTSGSNFPDQHGGAVMMNNSDAVMEHCLFTNNEAFADDNGMGGAIYGINTTEATQINFCTFKNNHTYGEGGAIKLTGDTGADITNCIFQNNTVLYGGGAVCLYGCYDTHFFRCLFTGNITSYTSGGAAFIEGYSARIRFVNCTMYDNHATGGDGGAVDIAFSDASFTNCIIYNNPGAYSDNIYLDFGYAEINYCDTPLPDGAEGNNNINTDAQFTDPNNGDFHLLPNSPCIDTGIDFLEITDAFGDTFVVINLDPSEYYNTAPDMGCYEYDPGVGIKRNEFKIIDIYPNPTDGTVHIDLPNREIAYISITDLSGKNVMNLYPGPLTTIDLTSLKKGTYLIFIKTNKGFYIGKAIRK